MTKLSIVLHGDNQLASRQALQKLKDQSPDAKIFDGRQVTTTELSQALEGSDLFGATGKVFIENLSPSVISYLTNHHNLSVIVWEGKKIPITTLKKLNLPDQEFKISPVIFLFLESLKPSSGNQQNLSNIIKNFDLACRQDAPELVFFMLIRQIRQLIQVITDPTTFKGPSWLSGKLLTQAKAFGLPKLLQFHHQFYQLDKAIKTGGTSLDLKTELELWMIKL